MLVIFLFIILGILQKYYENITKNFVRNLNNSFFPDFYIFLVKTVNFENGYIYFIISLIFKIN